MIIVEKKAVPLSLIISESTLGNTRMQKLLYLEFYDKMFKVCLRYAKNSADAEDILQEGFIKIFRNLDRFRGEGSFEGWIRKIITRTAISYLRDNSKKVNTHQTELNYTLEDKQCGIIDRMAEKEIVGIVTKLPPGYRNVFMMYVMEGYNHREIAGILGCSEGNCKSQLYRSRTQLQKILKKTA